VALFVDGPVARDGRSDDANTAHADGSVKAEPNESVIWEC
jgi:prepilin-type processing-associated H-X9-DG protein